jgi:hypothetical protein
MLQAKAMAGKALIGMMAVPIAFHAIEPRHEGMAFPWDLCGKSCPGDQRGGQPSRLSKNQTAFWRA